MTTILQDDHPRHQGRRQYDDTADGMPWWVKAIAFIGVPSTIALYLVYSMVNSMVPALQTGQTTMNNIIVMLNTIQADQNTAKQQNDQMIMILRASCVNSAKDVTERDRCNGWTR